MENGDIIVDDVSIRFRLADEKLDSLKELFIKKASGEEIDYNDFWALRNVSFELHKGDRLGILGLNGSGKSTLLKIIAGVYKPTRGTVKKQGLLMPMIELGAGFDPDYTGWENVYLYGAVLGYDRAFMKEKYNEIVDFAELHDFMKVPLKNYSSGMKARLGFAIATAVCPDILILDEVLSVGDAKFRKKSEAKMMEMMDKGTTVLFVSHSLDQVTRICDKALILDHGKMKAYGDIETVAPVYEQMIRS